MGIKVRVYSEEEGNDDMEEHEFPSKFEVCPECRGKGTIVNPNIDRHHGITQEEFENDPQFFDDYRNGVYDERCFVCKGLRVVEVVDTSRLDFEQKEIFSRYQEQENDRQQFEREWAKEIRMQEQMGGCW